MAQHLDASTGSDGHAMRRTVLKGGAIISLVAMAAAMPAFAAPKLVELVKFMGPVPATSDSKPWGTAMDGGPREKLVRMYDYVEEEYFVSGTANVYGPGPQQGNAGREPELGRHGIELTSRLRPCAAGICCDGH